MIGWLLAALAQSAPAAAPAPAAERTPAIERWESLGYGMFVHFGMATFTDDELGRKNSAASAFAPSALDVDQWIRVARDAGMRYAVLTTKHCCGHCLWDSAFTEHDIASSPGKTDVVDEFVRACRKHDVKPGFYYLLGWDAFHQPRLDPAAYETFCARQIEELLTRYGPIVELWLDIPSDMGPDAAGALRRLYARAKSLQPDCLVLLNQGFSDGRAPVAASPTYAWKPVAGDRFAVFPTDLLDGERTLPPAAGHDPWIPVDGVKRYLPMEVCDTLAHDWFWRPGDALKSARALARLHRECRARRANLLLDVAPDRSGRIPDGSVRRLMELKAVIADPSQLPASLTLAKKATASNVYRGDAAWGADRAIDGDSDTRWATDDGQTSAWLEVDLGAPATFNAAYLCEGFDRVREFELQAVDAGGAARTFHRGTTIGGDGATIRFAPVTARLVRLQIAKATMGPTIWDFELFSAKD